VPTQSNFEQIVQDHQAMVFRTLARLVGPQNLEDLAQDVFLRLYRALPNFRGDAQIATYLYRIAVNVAQNEWKRCRREDRRHVSLSDDADWESRLEHPAPNAIEQLEEHEFAQLVDEHLQRLTLAERSILVLYHQEERTYEQIAQTLSLPINTVRTHLHRGRKKLREALLQHSAIPSKVTTA
jgi:RNA polymerase sigma factor (sigma-70 family)